MPKCCKCKKNKNRNTFSKNQLKKPNQNRSCKSCIKKQQKQQNNNALKKKQEKPKKQENNDGDTYIESLQKEASKLEEPGHLSFIQELHNHCVDKLFFTEMYLAIKINPNKPLIAQCGLQRILSHWPGIFVYRNIIIIAGNDKSEQIGIMVSIKDVIGKSFGFIDSKTRICRKELLYQNGKISRKGIEFYDKQNILENVDIFSFLSKPITEDQEEKKEFMGSMAGKQYMKTQQKTKKLIELQNHQKLMKMKTNTLKREMIEKQNKMKSILDNNIMIKWKTFKNSLKKKKDCIFDIDDLEKFRNLLLNTMLTINFQIEQSDGYCNDILLTLNEKKTIMISGKTKNDEFLVKMEEIISYFIQQIESKWQLKEKQEINNNDDDNGNDESDAMIKLINTLKIDIIKLINTIKRDEREFNECSTEIAQILQNMINSLEGGLKENAELWNTEFYPTKLIFDLNGKHEAMFLSHISQKKQVIKQWISQRIDKYEGIGEYGTDHLFVRFINFIFFSGISFWIAILRWLSLPISIINLNLLRQYIRKSMDAHFIPNAQLFGTEIDVMMAVTYFMNATQKQYESNPLKLVYNVNKKDKLKFPQYSWEQEAQIIKLCHDCFNYVIDLIPKYKQSTTTSRMNKQIDIYMSRVRTHVARRSNDNSYRCVPLQ